MPTTPLHNADHGGSFIGGQIFIEMTWEYLGSEETTMKLKTILTIPHIILYLTFGIVISWIYLDYEQQSTKNYERKITGEMTARIEMYLDQYLSEPELLVQRNSHFIKSGYLDHTNLADLGHYFTIQLDTHPTLTYISFGSVEGEYIGARHHPRSKKIQLMTSLKQHGLTEMLYEVDPLHDQLHFVEKGGYFDARDRVWYQTAVQSGEQSWYPVYRYSFLNALGMGVSKPIYDQDNELVGVLTADVALSRISDFLESIPTEMNELIFMVDRAGVLLATSDDEPVFYQEGKEMHRITADQSKHPMINAAGQLFMQTLDVLEKQLILVDGNKYWLEEIEYKNHGFKFSIMIMIAEKELLNVMKGPLTKMIFAIVTTVLISVLIGGVLAKRISKRIGRLEQNVAERTIQLEKVNKELQKLAIIDPLTGIFNRRYFDETLKNEWNRAVRTGEPLSLLLCDIDYFKRYNDSQGHQAGDAVLVDIANILDQHVLRSTDSVARYGGEEFVLVLPNTDEQGARKLAGDILRTVNAAKIPHPDSKVSNYITVSIGGSTKIPTIQVERSTLIQSADQQLYLAKAKGRNCVRFSSTKGTSSASPL